MGFGGVELDLIHPKLWNPESGSHVSVRVIVRDLDGVLNKQEKNNK